MAEKVRDVEDQLTEGQTPADMLKRVALKVPELQPENIEVHEPSQLQGAIEKILLGDGVVARKYRQITNVVIKLMKERGGFCRSEDALYHFSKATHDLYNLESGLFRRALASQTGLRTTEAAFAFLLDSLQTEASEESPVKVHTAGYYDAATGALEVSLGGNKVYRREHGSEWVTGWNGDGRLFTACLDAEDCEPDFRSAGALDWLRDQTLITDHGLLTRDEQWALALIWLLSQFIPSLTRMILLALGEQGSGKTSFIRLLGRILLGSGFEVSNLSKDREDGLLAALSNSLFVAVDNADTVVDWLEDTLATYATGVRVTRRALYSNNDQIKLNLRAGMAISSRDSHFKRPDVAQRMLPIHFAAPATTITESELLDGLIKNRAGILGELLTLAGKIADSMTTAKAPRMPFRMADFATFGWHFFNATEPGKENRMPKLLEGLEAAQAAFAAEDDSVITVLRLLLWEPGAGEDTKVARIAGTLRLREGLKVIGKIGPMLTGDLYAVYKEIAEAQSLPMLKSAVSFGKKLTSMRRIIELELNATIRFAPTRAGGRVISIEAKPQEISGGGGGSN